MLLWRGATSAATRIDPYISSVNRRCSDARLAFLTNASDAAGRDAATPSEDRSDPGFIAARATWLLNNRQVAAARDYLAQPHQLSAPPSFVVTWFKLLLSQARGAAADGQVSAWPMPSRSQVDDAYPAGTDLPRQPYAREGRLYRPGLAGRDRSRSTSSTIHARRMAMFDRYSRPFEFPANAVEGAVLGWPRRGESGQSDSRC